MAKQPEIRWRARDEKELRRVIKNYNAKIRRVKRDKPELAEFQPETLKFTALRETITTRREFNNKIKSLQRYSRRGTEQVVTGAKGLTVSVYERNEVRIQTATFNRKQSMTAKRLKISPERGTSELIKTQNLRKKRFTIDKTETEWVKFKKGLERRLMEQDKEANLQRYFDDYQNSVTRYLGKEGERLLKYLNENVDSLETFFEQSLSDPILTIGFTSDPLDAQTIVNKALNNWQAIFG